MNSKLNILIACECSGAVRRAFRDLGHNAWSCDLLPAADGSPYHLQLDALDAIRFSAPIGGWHLVIAHPTCTRLALSGALRLYRNGKKSLGREPSKWEELDKAATFFRSFFDIYDGPLCVENPHMHGHALERVGNPLGVTKQVIQPHQFGDDASKATVLWLRGLPKLAPTSFYPPRLVCQCGVTWRAAEHKYCPGCGESDAVAKKRWANQTDSGQNKLPPSASRAADRAVTYRGVAEAMAFQWGNFLSK